jgi:Fungal Zn(2)-Cys(6) binuclear cluster domain/Fungal specific transcription factor domain
MVNTGKPSDACSKCRERRVKCDSLRPSCERCRKYGVDCPGYPEKNTLVFRNDTVAIQERAHKKYNKKKLKISDGSTSSKMRRRHLEERLVSRPRSRVVEAEPSLPTRTSLVSQPDSGTLIEGAVATFLSQWDNPNVDIFWCLFDPVAKQPTNSARSWGLGCAMNAVSLMALALRPEMETMDIRRPASTMYGQTLQYINAALQNPAETIDYETLLTVTLIALFERMYDSWDMPMPPVSAHIRGLMSLINARGPAQFQNPMAMKIFLFAYFNWTTTAMPELAVTPHLAHTHLPPLSNEIFHALHEFNIFGRDPAFSLITIVQRSLTLRALSISAIQTATHSSIPSIYSILAEIRSIDTSLWDWNRTLLPTDPHWGQEDRLYQMLLTSWYRTHRIFLADLAIISHQRLAELENKPHDLAIWEYTDVAQNAVDEICARIPYDFDVDDPRRRKPHVKPRVVPEAKITYLYHASFEYPLLVCSMVWTLPQVRHQGIAAARRECSRNCGLQRPWRTYPKVLIYLPAEQRAGWIQYKESFGSRLGAAEDERRIAAECWVTKRQEALARSSPF